MANKKKYIVAKKKGTDLSLGIVGATTVEQAKERMKNNNLPAEDYTYKIKQYTCDHLTEQESHLNGGLNE